jgi:hypothetical protein
VIALLAASSLLLADATTPPALAPLREVVYKVTTSLQISGNTQSYSGMGSTNQYTTDNGTVTVAVMAIQNNVLGVDVTELFNTKGRPATFQGNVTADGTVNFAAGSINDVTRELLQYFGPQFLAATTVDVGAKWKTSLVRGGATVDTTYSITKMDGPLLTIKEQQNVKMQATGATGTTTGDVVLKPSLLVPVKGDIQKVISQSTPEGFQKETLSLHFERVSDTRDQPSK